MKDIATFKTFKTDGKKQMHSSSSSAAANKKLCFTFSTCTHVSNYNVGWVGQISHYEYVLVLLLC